MKPNIEDNQLLKETNQEQTEKGPTASVSIYNRKKVKLEELSALLDTGAEISLVDYEIALKYEWILFKPLSIINGIGKSAIDVSGDTFVMVAPNEDTEATSLTLLVVKNLGQKMILGQDFLKSHKLRIKFDEKGMQIKQKLENVQTNKGQYKLRPANREEINEILCIRNQWSITNTKEVIEDGRGAWVRLIESSIPKRELDIMSKTESRSWEERIKAQIDGSLSKERKDKIFGLLLKYDRAFSKHPEDLGCIPANMCPIKIDIGDETVPYTKPYPQSLERRKRMRSVINKLLNLDIIEESNAKGGSPAILVMKKGKQDRMVIDYRNLNRLIKRRQYPMPRVDEFLEALRGMKYFALIDLAQGYYQIELSPAERAKTVFVTSGGKYQFKRLPMGLAESPAYFQQLVNKMTKDLKYDHCLGYLDDLPAIGRSFDEFLRSMKLLLAKICEIGLKARIEKCTFGCKEMKFLGFVVSGKGIKPDMEKVKALTDLP